MPDSVVCHKCGQEIIRRGWFWCLASEADVKKVSYCPNGGTHEVEEPDE
jgi:hypothetical protein